MSSPTSSATIEFPANRLSEVKECLERCYDLEFKPQLFGPGPLELVEETLWCVEIKVEDGIFIFHNSEAKYGEFTDLEQELIEKGIPFDRESRPDWDRPAELRVFRPGKTIFKADGDSPFPDTSLDLLIPQDSELCGLIRDIRAILKESGDVWSSDLQKIKERLDKDDPPYPPLAKFV